MLRMAAARAGKPGHKRFSMLSWWYEMTTSVTLPQPKRPRAFQTILLGGLVAGIFDGLDAVIFFGWTAGVSPGRIFQHIASGLLGTSAFHRGWYTILLGI